jgi:hypothetical protein
MVKGKGEFISTVCRWEESAITYSLDGEGDKFISAEHM